MWSLFIIKSIKVTYSVKDNSKSNIKEKCMNRRAIINMILMSNKYTDDEVDVIKGIEQSIMELQAARSMFEVVSDSKLIDLAIRKEDEAIAKYAYFLSEAKAKNITIDGSLMVEELNYLSRM